MAAKESGPNIQLRGELPEIELNMPLDKAKVDAIHKCLANGHLKITISKVDLVGGKLSSSWLYD